MFYFKSITQNSPVCTVFLYLLIFSTIRLTVLTRSVKVTYKQRSSVLWKQLLSILCTLNRAIVSESLLYPCLKCKRVNDFVVYTVLLNRPALQNRNYLETILIQLCSGHSAVWNTLTRTLKILWNNNSFKRASKELLQNTLHFGLTQTFRTTRPMTIGTDVFQRHVNSDSVFSC